MLVTPDSSPCHGQILLDSTNAPQPHLTAEGPLPTPPVDIPSKRRLTREEETPTKRPKLGLHNVGGKKQGEDVEDEDDTSIFSGWARRRTAFRMTHVHTPATLSLNSLPCRRILQSFVSSHKSDVFKCHSLSNNTFLTPPYACAYSNGAKRNHAPLLAVATEEGSVLILNTSKRQDWDFEPQRSVFQPHDNGVFDIKWSSDDTSLATASGDKTTRVCSVETQTSLQILQHHASTVKSVAWDPAHRDILSTGSRDGMICLWDLRIASHDAGNGVPVLAPVMTISAAHGQEKLKGGGRKKAVPPPRSVTSLLYTDTQPHGLVSSGSFDGILHLWDLRQPQADSCTRRSPKKTGIIAPSRSSPADPTTLNGSRRSRGITSLCSGSGPTASLLFAIGADSLLHTYSSPTMTPLEATTHPNMKASFYVRAACSPCGRWVASGCAGKNGSLLLFDVSKSARLSVSPYDRSHIGSPFAAVELRGQTGEVGALDWTNDMVATCADDGTVRVWRPNLDVYQKCVSDPDEQRWNWRWSEDV